jgi:hypothetical protein
MRSWYVVQMGQTIVLQRRVFSRCSETSTLRRLMSLQEGKTTAQIPLLAVKRFLGPYHVGQSLLGRAPRSPV